MWSALFALVFAFASAQNGNAETYRLSYEVVTNADENKTLNVSIFNASKKTITKFSLAVILGNSESEGEYSTASDESETENESGENLRVFEREETLLPKASERFSFDLGAENGDIDFAFVRKLEFTDGSEWNDEYGVKGAL